MTETAAGEGESEGALAGTDAGDVEGLWLSQMLVGVAGMGVGVGTGAGGAAGAGVRVGDG